MRQPTVSIIIRTRNEERWITPCFEALFSQSYQDFEIVVVDNESTDKTLDKIRQFSVEKILTISDYLPGKALNLGIDKAVFRRAERQPADSPGIESLRRAVKILHESIRPKHSPGDAGGPERCFAPAMQALQGGDPRLRRVGDGDLDDASDAGLFGGLDGVDLENIHVRLGAAKKKQAFNSVERGAQRGRHAIRPSADIVVRRRAPFAEDSSCRRRPGGLRVEQSFCSNTGRYQLALPLPSQAL